MARAQQHISQWILFNHGHSFQETGLTDDWYVRHNISKKKKKGRRWPNATLAREVLRKSDYNLEGFSCFFGGQAKPLFLNIVKQIMLSNYNPSSFLNETHIHIKMKKKNKSRAREKPWGSIWGYSLLQHRPHNGYNRTKQNLENKSREKQIKTEETIEHPWPLSKRG